MAFQFGTNWSVLSKMSGPIQGPLLSYEIFTAFTLEATFLAYSSTAVPACRLIVFPLMLLYTIISYTVFRGKVPSTSQIYH
jgi:cytochrome bd-type quinol oxidase subunit 1